MILLAGAREKK